VQVPSGVFGFVLLVYLIMAKVKSSAKAAKAEKVNFGKRKTGRAAKAKNKQQKPYNRQGR